MDNTWAPRPVRGTLRPMTRTRRESWLLSDPATTLSEILDREEAAQGRTLVAYVGEDPEKVIAVRSLPTPAPYLGDDESAADEALEELRAQLLAIAEEIAPGRIFADGRWGAMHGTLVTVVCRDGYVVSTADEMQFYPAWRYTNHFTIAFAGDVFAVTPHGWTSTLTEACGLHPALPALG